MLSEPYVLSCRYSICNGNMKHEPKKNVNKRIQLCSDKMYLLKEAVAKFDLEAVVCQSLPWQTGELPY